MTNKEIEALNTVEQINIIHNFEQLIKDTVTKYKNSLGLPNMSENELINLLVENKQDKLVNNLRTLIATRELIKHKQWVEKANDKNFYK